MTNTRDGQLLVFVVLQGSRKGRTRRTINALGVNAIERGAGGVVAVRAASRRAHRNSGAVQDGDGLGVGVGTSLHNGDGDSEDESDSEEAHDVSVQREVSWSAKENSSLRRPKWRKPGIGGNREPSWLTTPKLLFGPLRTSFASFPR